MTDYTEGKLEEAKEYAKSINDASLQECLNHLTKVDELQKTETNIMTDRAKHCFYFERWIANNENMLAPKVFRGNGGIIFHGTPDGGHEVNHSVQMNPSYGWQIHT